MKKVWLIEIISICFIILFIYASLSKLDDFEKFRIQLSKSPVINPFAGLIAWLIPVVEILIALLLSFKRYQLLGLYASFTIMVIFSAYIIVILKFSKYIPCSCGGILENMSWLQHLIFNIIFVFLGATSIIIFPSKSKDIVAQQ